MTRFFLDRVWQWCKSLENRLGYNRITEALCARLTWWVMPMAAKQALKTGRPTVFVTCWMPAYLSNIEAVLDDLAQRGHHIVIFPEWREQANAAYTEGLRAYSRWTVLHNLHRALPMLQSSVFLSSTATKHFYFSQSPRRFFYFHSVAGLKGFPEGGMDDYTDFLCATSQQVSELRARFERLSLSRTFHEVGYPKFDAIVRRLKASDTPAEPRTLLIAPSYAADDVYADVSMLGQLPDTVRQCLAAGWRVIFRPHPVSLQRGHGLQVIRAVREEFGHHPAFEFDDSQDYVRTYQRATVMLTDVSGTSLMFRLAFKKPVVFFSPRVEAAIEAFDAIPELGPLTSDLTVLMGELTRLSTSTLPDCSVRTFNPGTSATAMADVLVHQMS